MFSFSTDCQPAEEQSDSSSHLQIRAAQTGDLTGLAGLLADSFHSHDGILGWAYPLLRLGIYEDLRNRLRSNSPHHICLVAVERVIQTTTEGSPNCASDELATPVARHFPQRGSHLRAQRSPSGGPLCSELREPLLPQSGVEPAHGAGSETKARRWLGTLELGVRSKDPWAKERSRYLYVSNLAVCPTYRRRGVAKQLLLSCERVALTWGFQDLYLHVLENNHQARQLYFKLGYRLHQVDSSWNAWLLGRPRQLFLHKHLSSDSLP